MGFGPARRNRGCPDIDGADVTDPHQIESVAEQVVASGSVDVVFKDIEFALVFAIPLEKPVSHHEKRPQPIRSMHF
jgi:hypothetical protein